EPGASKVNCCVLRLIRRPSKGPAVLRQARFLDFFLEFLKDLSQSFHQKVVLLLRTNGDPEAGVEPPRRRGPHDHAALKERLEDLLAVLARIHHYEVAPCGVGLKPHCGKLSI